MKPYNFLYFAASWDWFWAKAIITIYHDALCISFTRSDIDSAHAKRTRYDKSPIVDLDTFKKKSYGLFQTPELYE